MTGYIHSLPLVARDGDTRTHVHPISNKTPPTPPPPHSLWRVRMFLNDARAPRWGPLHADSFRPSDKGGGWPFPLQSITDLTVLLRGDTTYLAEKSTIARIRADILLVLPAEGGKFRNICVSEANRSYSSLHPSRHRNSLGDNGLMHTVAHCPPMLWKQTNVGSRKHGRHKTASEGNRRSFG